MTTYNYDAFAQEIERLGQRIGQPLYYIDRRAPLPRPQVLTAPGNTRRKPVHVVIQPWRHNAVSLIQDASGTTLLEAFAPGSLTPDADLSRLQLRLRHDADEAVGQAVNYRTTAHGPVITFEIADSTAGRDTAAGLETGTLAPSGGFIPSREHTDLGAPGGLTLRTYTAGVRLVEVSAVTRPAHASARVLAITRGLTLDQTLDLTGINAQGAAYTRNQLANT